MEDAKEDAPSERTNSNGRTEKTKKKDRKSRKDEENIEDAHEEDSGKKLRDRKSKKVEVDDQDEEQPKKKEKDQKSTKNEVEDEAEPEHEKKSTKKKDQKSRKNDDDEQYEEQPKKKEKDQKSTKNEEEEEAEPEHEEQPTKGEDRKSRKKAELDHVGDEQQEEETLKRKMKDRKRSERKQEKERAAADGQELNGSREMMIKRSQGEAMTEPFENNVQEKERKSKKTAKAERSGDETVTDDASASPLVGIDKKSMRKRNKMSGVLQAAKMTAEKVDKRQKLDGQTIPLPRKQKKKKEKKTSVESEKKSYNWDQDDDSIAEDDVEEIEGFVFEGTLLLRDKKSDKIYASERDDDGNLVQVGTYSSDGKHNFTSFQWKLASFQQEKDEPLKFFVTDPNDHCETSIKPYLDIKRALEEIAALMEVIPASSLRIWDPFYCTGRMRTHMVSIGFPQIHNVNEDFYRIIRDMDFPSHDILLTNPPYSQDHIPRLLEYCKTSPAPCFLLLPGYVAKKDYFYELDDPKSRYFFIIPTSGRYTYHNPGIGGSKVGRTAPFQSFWFINAKQYRSELLRKLTSIQSSEETSWELHKTDLRIPSRFFDAVDEW